MNCPVCQEQMHLKLIPVFRKQKKGKFVVRTNPSPKADISWRWSFDPPCIEKKLSRNICKASWNFPFHRKAGEFLGCWVPADPPEFVCRNEHTKEHQFFYEQEEKKQKESESNRKLPFFVARKLGLLRSQK